MSEQIKLEGMGTKREPAFSVYVRKLLMSYIYSARFAIFIFNFTLDSRINVEKRSSLKKLTYISARPHLFSQIFCASSYFKIYFQF